MKYQLNIPLANYPDTRTHIKEFNNVLDVIEYLKQILNNHIKDDWNCHIQEAIMCNAIYNSKEEEIKLSQEFKDLYEEYNEYEFLDYMFYHYVTVNKQCQ